MAVPANKCTHAHVNQETKTETERERVRIQRECGTLKAVKIHRVNLPTVEEVRQFRDSASSGFLVDFVPLLSCYRYNCCC